MGKCTDVRLGQVIEHLAKQFALQASDLTGTSREKEIVRARQLAMWCCRRLVPQPSLPAIGRAFNRDHTSVLEALRVAERLLHAYPRLLAALGTENVQPSHGSGRESTQAC